MTEDWFDFAMIAFIVAGIAVAVWKGGQANPEGTGSLAKKLAKLEADVRALRASEGRLATKADVAAVKAQLSEHDGRLKTMQDGVTSIENEVVELRESAASRHATLDHVKMQVDRLYDFIVQRGMSK